MRGSQAPMYRAVLTGLEGEVCMRVVELDGAAGIFQVEHEETSNEVMLVAKRATIFLL